MQRLCPLLSHDACTQMPSPHPGDCVGLEDVHLWQDSGVGEIRSVERHELRYILFYELKITTVNINPCITILMLTQLVDVGIIHIFGRVVAPVAP